MVRENCWITFYERHMYNTLVRKTSISGLQMIALYLQLGTLNILFIIINNCCKPEKVNFIFHWACKWCNKKCWSLSSGDQQLDFWLRHGWKPWSTMLSGWDGWHSYVCCTLLCYWKTDSRFLKIDLSVKTLSHSGEVIWKSC